MSKKSPHLATDELLQQYINEETYSDYFVNLSPYINDSGVSVPLHFSLHRAYILFRTLGLRHMTVVSHTNQVRLFPSHSRINGINTLYSQKVEGILTRKDLMGFAIEEKLERLLRHPHRKLSRSVVLALRKNYGPKVKGQGGNGQGGVGGGMGGVGGGGAANNAASGEKNGNNLDGGEAGLLSPEHQAQHEEEAAAAAAAEAAAAAFEGAVAAQQSAAAGMTMPTGATDAGGMLYRQNSALNHDPRNHV